MSESAGRVSCERRPGRIAIVTIDRPQALNACSRAMWRELAGIWDELMQDDGVSVVVLTGAGDRAFSAGVDLVEMARGEPNQNPYQPPPRLLENWDLEFWKPVVCAVNGLALGSGFSLMLATDIRIASEKATFGMRQVKLGLLSGHATQLLPRFLSYPLAMELLLTGETIGAQRALEIGLINRVVEHDHVLAEATELATQIASHPTLTLQGIKEAAVRGLGFNLRDAIVWGLRMERLNSTTEDAAEGPRAFAEKRPARWKGR
jgi:enoyl-CoA hydratase/carnithine racemase